MMNSNRPTNFVAILFLALMSACSTIANGSDAGSPNNSVTTAPGLLSGSNKQNLGEITFNGCPPQGDGGDAILNENKNRVDNGNYQPTDFNTILNLQWPQETERRAHDTWSTGAQAQVAQTEGLPVAVVGYLALARQEGPETPNCHSTTDADYHVWFIDHPGSAMDRVNSIIAETTPRVRVNHTQWTVNNLLAIAQAGTQVRISGWLMLDPEHPEQLGKTRGTLWEIHPIMQIELSQNGQWVPLDSGSVPQGGSTSLNGDNPPSTTSTSTTSSGQTSCPGLSYTCSQLTCEQAKACLAAGNKSLDGNGDGIPCNSKCSQ
ncbi:MAG TPA: excalibur calcium-binding domain-containing protein [Aggregatilineales bacterium]|nr:excalibur calcium-binding domain-containing protein [Aggregatilineales bacterium]